MARDRRPSKDEAPRQWLEDYPYPLLIKAANLRYVWVNGGYERLFCLNRREVLGRLDMELFMDRQAVQCSGGDLRVLETGNHDEAPEILLHPARGHRDVVTRKSRLILADQRQFLLGVLFDVTDDRHSAKNATAAYEAWRQKAHHENEGRTALPENRSLYELALESLLHDAHYRPPMMTEAAA